ncbi:MAG: DoxX family membrane protein, partial [Burkholderiales bacterium]
EYHVPLLPPALSAVKATAGQLVLAVLLVLGLGTRRRARGRFIVNAIAVISYPMTGVALELHGYWAMLIAALLISGAGHYSLDNWLIPGLKVRWKPANSASGCH